MKYLKNEPLPRITIVTPSFNQAKFLRETIESVLNQNYPDLEYFIVDGGSTDNSVEIIRSYEDRIDWWVSEKDNGQADAICRGFERSTGKVIGWLNSDDVLFPNALYKVGEAYMRNPRASIYAGGLAVGGLHDGPICKCMIPGSPCMWLPDMNRMTIGQQSSFYSREIYNRIGGLNRDLYIRMDGDLWFRLMKAHPHAVIIRDMIGFIRWHDDTKSSKSEYLYLKEKADFEAFLGVPGWKLRLAKNIFRMGRLINGSYIRSWKVTMKLRDRRMSDIWKEYFERQEH